MNAQNKINFRKVTDSSGFPLAGTTILVKELNPQRSNENGITILKLKEEKISLFIYRFITKKF
jgi:hypothetical protein